MHELNFDLKVNQIMVRDQRYRREAYVFVREALDFTRKLISREDRQNIRHVTGQQLLDGIRQFALKEFGPMAATVLEEWGVTSCPDFGEIVFNMVDVGLLGLTDQDRREHFQNGYDFTTAFRKPFWPQDKQDGPKKEVAELN
ncbi:MAG TPA: Minf_1886 family protein [Candidatus Sulfotelmatobacter sp.]|nr:Minf_1886 family protein [Candidatus Sulfotelmatobacter sp.]